MSDSNPLSFPGFGKLVPGFDFLQNLAKQAAGSASKSIPQLPNLGNWVAPTLNVEELDKRIDELKTVQFWLDQNAMALKATIQALEVQKMTLATLKGMNFNMGDVANAFKLKVADTLADTMTGAQKAAGKAAGFAGLEVPETSYQKAADERRQAEAEADDEDDDSASEASEQQDAKAAAKAAPKSRAGGGKSGKTAAAPVTAGVVDPLQWWGALTQQFQNIATDAMKEAGRKVAVDATKGLARDAMASATGMAREMADSATKAVTGNARKAMSTALRSAQPWPTPVAAKSASATRSASKTASKSKAAPKSDAKSKAAPKSRPKATAKTARKTGR